MKITKKIDGTIPDSDLAKRIREYLNGHVIGQNEPVDKLVEQMERYHAALYDHNRPFLCALHLGPTGTGKTLLAESLSEVLFGTKAAMIRVDCAEYENDGDVAKLLGSPPGYIGYMGTSTNNSLITNERLEKWRNQDYQLSVILFDEIEKSCFKLWNLMLGILDTGTLTLGNNTTLDLTKTIILMTSNVGSGEMDKAIGVGATGFSHKNTSAAELKHIAIEAAKRKFPAEFINRLDYMTVFNTLDKTQLRQIVDLELAEIQTQLYMAKKFVFLRATNIMKRRIVDEGYDPKYNARNIRRVIEQRIQVPLARLIASGAVEEKAEVIFDCDNNGEYSIHTAIEGMEQSANEGVNGV